MSDMIDSSIVTGEVAAPVAEAAPRPGVMKFGYFWGTGRRKTSVARVRVRPGQGKIVVNEREYEEYFPKIDDRNRVTAPLAVTNSIGRFDVFVNVAGGGPTGQSGAVLLGLSRALVSANGEFEATLRDSGYLTRDAREVERKKYGRRKARRRFQFSKR